MATFLKPGDVTLETSNCDNNGNDSRTTGGNQCLSWLGNGGESTPFRSKHTDLPVCVRPNTINQCPQPREDWWDNPEGCYNPIECEKHSDCNPRGYLTNEVGEGGGYRYNQTYCNNDGKCSFCRNIASSRWECDEINPNPENNCCTPEFINRCPFILDRPESDTFKRVCPNGPPSDMQLKHDKKQLRKDKKQLRKR